MLKLRCLTLNVWSIPWPIARDVPERIRAIAARLPEFDADVIAFQEVWTRSSRRTLVRAGRESGYTFWWHNGGSSGMLVLSRVPVRGVRFRPFTLNGLPQRLQHLDYYGNKGLVHLELETREGPVALIAAHLHARYTNSGDDMDYLGHRGAQVIELADTLAPLEEPTIVLGDLNLHEGSPHYLALCGLTGLTDCAAALNRREPTIVYDNPYRLRGNKSGRRIDYVLTRDGATIAARPSRIQRVFDERFEISGHPGTYSDHAGLMSEVLVGDVAAPISAPSAAAVSLARQFLEVGRSHAKLRRSEKRLWGASGAVACLTAIGARRGVATRRRFLRGALVGMPALGLAGCAGITTFGESFVSRELQGYDRVSEILDEMAARATPATD